MSFLSLMAITLPERALLEKLFYESKGIAAAALREFRRLKNLRKGPLLPQALKRMFARFEKTGHLGVQPGRDAYRPVQMSLNMLPPLLLINQWITS
ncbi:DUF4817 domain-containing protein [Trichonephila clavipes]|nr:DUF4817 domain-containing protein [Trichonephila clavipes]